MRHSFWLVTLGIVLAFGMPNSLRAQASPAPSASQTNETAVTGKLASPVTFEWKRGPLDLFLDQVKRVFGYDLRAHADIPNEMLYSRLVPSMKIQTAQVWDVLSLYNQVSKDYASADLGKWVWKWAGEFAVPGERIPKAGPSVLLLVPQKQSDTEESFIVRAFSLRDIPEPEQKTLLDVIITEQNAINSAKANPSFLAGEVHFHKKAGICVATGGKTYVEMVGSLIDAMRGGNHPQIESGKPKSEK